MSDCSDDRLLERLMDLEERFNRLIDVLEFFHPEGIPQKYRQSGFSGGNGSPFFKLDKFREPTPKSDWISSLVNNKNLISECEWPKDPKAYQTAKERMLIYAELVKPPESAQSPAAS